MGGLATGAAMAQQRGAELADLSLEQLANITVTSASRRTEPLLQAPASVFVITAEDIRRAGAVTLFDALRIAPNLQVVRGDANQVIASARGGLFGTANKMLVLVDGRTIYTPLFAGVFSDAQDLVMEDIERIEVISGPGSTLWGTNAVNGVINVTTKSAARTQGTLAVATAGSEHREATLRHGGPMGDGGSYRVYAKYGMRSPHELEGGAPARDDSERWQAGFRADWEAGSVASAVQGDLYGANVDNLGGERTLSGGNLRARTTWSIAAGSQLMVQAYYDGTEREHLGSFEESRRTWDLEVQHSVQHGERDRFVWGGELRTSSDRTTSTPALGFSPTGRDLHFPSVFAQEERQVSAQLRATVGVRLEHNDYTGSEWLPNVRLAFMPSQDQLWWSALTRTVRAPSRIDRDLVIPGNAPPVIGPSPTFASEVADVAELGWRGRVGSHASLSATAFHHRFRGLRGAEPVGSLLEFTNAGHGRVSGIEAWGDLTVNRDWRLIAGVVAMQTRYDVDPGHVDISGSGLGNNPRHTAQLRSLWNVTSSMELDATLREVGRLPNPVVPGYTLLDMRLGWRVSRDLDVSVLVGDVFNRRYREIGTPTQSAFFGRSGLVRLTWTPS